MAKEKEGEFDLHSKTIKSTGTGAQISSYSISLDGYDIVTSNGAVGILSFLPDIDKIKRKRIREALGSLTFKNRVPKIIFTVNYEPDGVSRGNIIGWKRIFDASSYTLKRHDIFENKEIEYEFSNEDLVSQYEFIKNYVNEWVLSFYDHIDDDMVYAVLDKEIVPHHFYVYTLVANQLIRTDKDFVFNVDTSLLAISRLQLKDIGNEIASHVKNTVGKKIKDADVDDVNPYPFISKRFYGNDKYDWILAAINVKAAKERGDDRTTVRKFSYLGANHSFISEQIRAGRFFRPTDPDEIVKNVNESITTFGVTQTLLDIIENTGLDFYFGSKESSAEEQFKRATAVLDEVDLGGITTILSIIDPETATVDVESLVSNLLLVSQGRINTNQVDESSKPTEIDVPPQQKDEEIFSEDPLQFVGDFDASQEILDLTTFDGISEFIRIIRLFFDMSPNRAIFGTTQDDAGLLG